MNDAKNLQAVKDFLEAFGKGDAKGMLAPLAEDVELIVSGDPAVIPWGGRHRGLAGAERLFGIMDDKVTYEAFEAKAIVGQGEQYAVIASERWRVKATGRVCEQEYAVHLTTRNGRISRVRSYEDTAAQAAAFKPR